MKRFNDYKINEEFLSTESEEDIESIKVVNINSEYKYKSLLKIKTKSGRIFYSKLNKYNNKNEDEN